MSARQPPERGWCPVCFGGKDLVAACWAWGHTWRHRLLSLAGFRQRDYAVGIYCGNTLSTSSCIARPRPSCFIPDPSLITASILLPMLAGRAGKKGIYISNDQGILDDAQRRGTGIPGAKGGRGLQYRTRLGPGWRQAGLAQGPHQQAPATGNIAQAHDVPFQPCLHYCSLPSQPVLVAVSHQLLTFLPSRICCTGARGGARGGVRGIRTSHDPEILAEAETCSKGIPGVKGDPGSGWVGGCVWVGGGKGVKKGCTAVVNRAGVRLVGQVDCDVLCSGG